MKFLCVPCDSPMKMSQASPPERGSISVVYECPECFHTMAMLTNPMETQLVQSLGVKIGPASADEKAAGAKGNGCPFSGMAEEMSDDRGDAAEFAWTPAAEKRLGNIPSFVRAVARTGIEKYARENGFSQVDEQVLDQAKDYFGM
ncbi:MAG: PCP reductase family protein [Acidobacteria bacterium]|nr:PCP reductase family protein [Acidobacteriota bacterium]MCZ6650703.1 PCP reductase family protein [Acidobacteriota bacterium]MCZ6745588.1 PCP reductase family protein [Acidobacteriota bacterium]